MSKGPYIGITGFMSREEVIKILKVVPITTMRKLMVGVLVSSKTMRGIPDSHPNRYPAPEKVSGIFTDHLKVFNVIHFNTKNPEKLLPQMLKATEIGGRNLHGIQLNVKWPDPCVLYEYKKRYPEKVIILQCGAGALEEVGHDPVRLAIKVASYQRVCDYVLIDPSGGQGIPFDTCKGLSYLASLNFYVKNMLFGIAGGLSPATLYDLFSPIADIYPTTSIDAEGRLRDGNDNLDVLKAKEFVSRAFKLFGN